MLRQCAFPGTKDTTDDAPVSSSNELIELYKIQIMQKQVCKEQDKVTRVIEREDEKNEDRSCERQAVKVKLKVSRKGKKRSEEEETKLVGMRFEWSFSFYRSMKSSDSILSV